jgi:tryptophan synthase beta chain
MACIGGGSNAMGTYFHFLDDERVNIISAEAGGMGIETGKTAATIHLGKTGIIHGAKTLILQNEDDRLTTLFVSAGLDYRRWTCTPFFTKIGRTKVYAINDDEAMEAALN